MDFSVRLREAILLIREAKLSTKPVKAAAFSKSASVLLAAALERYVNDALDHASRLIKVSVWNDLPDGFRAILVAQIVRRLQEAIEPIQSPADASKSRKQDNLRSAVNDSAQALIDPSGWSYQPQLGAFMDGAAVPGKLDSHLRRFRSDGKQLFDWIEERGLDRGMFARALTDLVSTRHAAAHAKSDPGPPSPNDVTMWLTITFRLVREIEEYLFEPLERKA